jgi:hypothetical protein
MRASQPNPQEIEPEKEPESGPKRQVPELPEEQIVGQIGT